MNTYLTGNTVRLLGEINDWSGNPTDPATVKFTIYNYKYEEIFTTTLGVANKTATGKYFYDYKTSDVPQKYIYEFKAEIGNLPSINRGVFITKFI